MQEAAQRSRTTAYLLILLLPLLGLGLASYSGFVQRTADEFVLQGFVPQRLSAQQPFAFQLLAGPGAADYRLWLEDPRTQTTQILPSRLNGSYWHSEVPALAPGVYRLHWRHQQAEVRKPSRSLPLFVAAQPGQILSDRPVYAPGDPLVLRLTQFPPTATEAHLHLSVDGHIQSERIALQAGEGHWQGRVPLEASRPINLTVRGAFPGVQSLQLPLQMPQASDQRLRIWPLTHFIARSAEPQSFPIFALTQTGQAVENGWIQALDRSVPITNGYAEIELPAHFQAQQLEYTAGDSQGHLLQGSWPLQQLTQSWSAKYQPETAEWQISGARPTPIFWMLWQHQHLLAQGVVEAQSEPQRLPLPTLAAEATMLLLRDAQGNTQKYHWLPATQPGRLQIQPSAPHALEPLHFSDPAGFSGLDLAQYRLTGQRAYQPVAPAWHHQGQWLDQAFVSAESSVWFSFWVLAALGCVILPWSWLWFLLQQRIRQRQRPFLNRQRKQRIHQAQKQLLLSGFLGLLLAVLSCLQVYPVLFVVCAFVLSVGTGVSLSLKLKQLQLDLPVMTSGLPLLQSQLWFCIFCFIWVYQPLGFSSCFLTWSLLQLSWWWLLQRLGPSQILTYQAAVLLLASLCVLSPLNLSWRLLKPLTEPPQGTAEAIVLASAVPQLQLLNYYPRPQHLTQLQPAYHKGAHWLQWRTQQAEGPLQTQVQTLPIQPALTIQAQVPHFALSGDRLEIPLSLQNETQQVQQSRYRFEGQRATEIQLSAVASEQVFRPWQVPLQRGWQALKVQHMFLGTWFERSYPIFVQAAEPALQDRALVLEVGFPAVKQLVLGEEIPVRVRFSQHFSGTRALGIQIGIPAGFEVLTDTLNDSNYTQWLSDYQVVPGYLNLWTHPVSEKTVYGAHFRLRAGLAGQIQAPSSRLFDLQQPERLTRVVHPGRFDVKVP